MKKIILTLCALAAMAIASTCSAQIVYDYNDQPHYVMCKAGMEQQFDENASFTPRPVHEVLGWTEEEFEEFSKGEGGRLPSRHIKNPIIFDVEQ